MTKDDTVKKPSQTPAPGSGSGADSALEALIRKRAPRAEQPEQQPQHRARPVPDAGT